MTRDRKALDLEDERNAQRRYRRKVQQRASQPVTHQGPRNSLWTGTGLPSNPTVPFGALVGRVALSRPNHELLDGHSDFYIGETYAELDGVYVYSWAAPVACTFFRGSLHHELCHEVALVRAFDHRGEDIADFYDEPVGGTVPERPFHRRSLTVPEAPKRANKFRRPVPASPGLNAPTTATPKESSTTPASGLVPPPRRHNSPSGAAIPPAANPQPVRAEGLLRSRLTAPRTRSLAPVLATLQPDQYELVTVPAMDSMIIEGQPGTGKTIAATHRAAYLVSDSTPPENSLDGDVLIVGPTIGYSQHVQPVVSRLTGESRRVKVLSLPELMQQILGRQHEPEGAISRTRLDVDPDLAEFVQSAITRLRRMGVPTTLETVYDYLRRNGTHGNPLTPNKVWAANLRGLPPIGDALTRRVHSPLLAIIQWKAARPSDLAGIEHIIVDEAQDVTPLEWCLLASINEADAWTIIGDLNQRRSDHTPTSWNEILSLISVPYGDPPIRRLKRGYRSTRPILEYANRLLPAAERELLAFQAHGPEPVVEKCRETTLGPRLLHHLERLLVTYPLGTVAAITAEPRTVETILRRAGWARSLSERFTWENASREVTVAHPDAVRGLEFDGVIVIEPGNFPQNFGRQGPLYTALTRPNRELAVIHTQPLIESLRTRKPLARKADDRRSRR